MRAIGLCLISFLGIAAPLLATDLTQRYRATLDFSEQGRGYEWTTAPQDVWRLTEFGYALGDAFRVKLGPSQVVFGCHESNVVWAAILPNQPGEIVAASSGQGEHVTSIWLRFHPVRAGRAFSRADRGRPGRCLGAASRKAAGRAQNDLLLAVG